MYIVGAGALIPYKRGDDDVGWFMCYRHSEQGVSRVKYDVKRCSCF